MTFSSQRSSTHSSKAIVIAVDSFGEADSYVRFLTQKWGVISTLAKSARKSRKRYAGGLDLFCHDEIFVRGDPKERPYLVELSVLNAFTGIRDDLNRLFAAGKLIQWIRKLADIPTPMPTVYSLTGQLLALIEKESDPNRLELLILVFKIRLLTQLGLKPHLESCTRCEGQELSPWFDVASGGLVCRNCRQSFSMADLVSLQPEDAKILKATQDARLSLWENFPCPPPNQLDPLNRLLTRFAAYHTHTHLPV